MIRYLNASQVVKIHDQQIVCPIRDQSALESAVNKPQTSYAGIEIYKTLPEKGAALLDGLAMNHPFLDGNKRTSWMATVAFLGINGLIVAPIHDEEVVEFMVAVVEYDLAVADISRWLNQRVK